MDKERTGDGRAAGPRQESEGGAPEGGAEGGAPGSGWISTENAAAALGVSPRTVRDYIRSGALEAKSEGVGVLKRWLVSKGGVRAMVEERRSDEDLPPNRRESAAVPSPTSEGAAAGVADRAEGAAEPTEMRVESQDLRYRLGYAEARLDLTERFGVALQAERDRLLEDLGRERERADGERGRVEESRRNADQLEQQEFDARQKAERLEWERDQIQEEARGLREELEAERTKGLRRVVLAGTLLIIVVVAVAVTMASLLTSQA